jgi:hypothetical protein
MKLKSIATIIILTTLSIGIFAQKVTEIVSDEPMMTLGTGGNEKYPYWFRSENGGKLFVSNIVQTDKKDLNSWKLFFSELDLTTNRLRNVYSYRLKKNLEFRRNGIFSANLDAVPMELKNFGYQKL